MQYHHPQVEAGQAADKQNPADGAGHFLRPAQPPGGLPDCQLAEDHREPVSIPPCAQPARTGLYTHRPLHGAIIQSEYSGFWLLSNRLIRAWGK